MQKLTDPCNPTRYLFVQWSKSLKSAVSKEGLLPFFSRHGEVTLISIESSKHAAVISYASSDQAASARAALDGQPCGAVKGRKLFVYFCDKKSPSYGSEGCASVDLDEAAIPVPGLRILPNFISEAEEEALLSKFSPSYDWHEVQLKAGFVRSRSKSRRVRHFGYAFDYATNRCHEADYLGSLPEFLGPVLQRISGCGLGSPDQLTVNEYAPGQGIPPHIDTHSAFEDGILSLSLGSSVAMDFSLAEDEIGQADKLNNEIRRQDGPFVEGLSCRRFSVYVPRRSLLIMTGAARYAWTHGIIGRKTDLLLLPSSAQDRGEGGEDGVEALSVPLLAVSRPFLPTPVHRDRRVSLTFRKVHFGPCTRCGFKLQCDSQVAILAAGERPDSLVPSEMERVHVHAVYDAIAPHFAATRHSPWPRVQEFVSHLPRGALIVDIGCGNGKYMPAGRAGVGSWGGFAIGSDMSLPIAEIAARRGCDILQCDTVLVPLRSACADFVLSIAVLHHIASPLRRRTAAMEILRVLRPGGCALVYAWAQEQNEDSRRQFSLHKQDVFVPWHLQQRYIASAPLAEPLRSAGLPSAESPEVTVPAGDSNDLSFNSALQSTEGMRTQDYLGSSTSGTPRTASLAPCETSPHGVADGNGGLLLQRYCHVFSSGELPALFDLAAKQLDITAVVEEEYYDESNWCVVVRRCCASGAQAIVTELEAVGGLDG